MRYEKQYKILKSKDKVQEIFSDLTVFGSYHPLIQSVTKVENQEVGTHIYRIIEQPFSWVPIKIEYVAQVIVDTDTIEYIITGVPFLQPAIKYRLSSKEDHTTQLTFVLDIKGIIIGKHILSSKMIDAQNILIESINQSTLS